MAFMMPVMKNEYSLYAKGNNNRHRKTSGPAGTNSNHSVCDEAPDRRKYSAPVGMRTSASAAGVLVQSKRKVRSEGPSLCTSPRHIVISNRNPSHVPHISCALESQTDGSHPVSIRRVRGSAPVLGMHSSASPIQRQISVADSNASTNASKNLSRSGSSSSESSNPDKHHGEKFHSKLLSRLKKSLRLSNHSSKADTSTTTANQVAA